MRTLVLVVVGVLCSGLALVWLVALAAPTRKLDGNEVRERVAAIYESSAWHVPHFDLDGGQIRSRHEELFRAMEDGERLGVEESRRYRVVYQEILAERRSRLAFFDRDLTVRVDYAMDRKNNVGGHGIEGAHDHHDASIRANLEDIRGNLDRLDGASPLSLSPRKALAGLLVYKDTMDLLLHVGTVPQTKSTAYEPAGATDRVGQLTEEMLAHFKRAQFSPINSSDYWRHVDRGLDAYTDLVLHVQDRVHHALTPPERVLVGTWGGWQSLGPSPDGDRGVRPRPTDGASGAGASDARRRSPGRAGLDREAVSATRLGSSPKPASRFASTGTDTARPMRSARRRCPRSWSRGATRTRQWPTEQPLRDVRPTNETSTCGSSLSVAASQAL